MKKPKLPQTDSIQKLAEFWDAHDLTDFEDELQEVKEPIFARARVTARSKAAGAMGKRAGAISVPLKTPEAQAVKRMARSKGVSPQQLVRGWVLQKIAGRSNGRASAKH